MAGSQRISERYAPGVQEARGGCGARTGVEKKGENGGSGVRASCGSYVPWLWPRTSGHACALRTTTEARARGPAPANQVAPACAGCRTTGAVGCEETTRGWEGFEAACPSSPSSVWHHKGGRQSTSRQQHVRIATFLEGGSYRCRLHRVSSVVVPDRRRRLERVRASRFGKDEAQASFDGTKSARTRVLRSKSVGGCASQTTPFVLLAERNTADTCAAKLLPRMVIRRGCAASCVGSDDEEEVAAAASRRRDGQKKKPFSVS
ncbi:hypothetical protein MTO96_000267 [Rhipicephalus appendiculatus]